MSEKYWDLDWFKGAQAQDNFSFRGGVQFVPSALLNAHGIATGRLFYIAAFLRCRRARFRIRRMHYLMACLSDSDHSRSQIQAAALARINS